jgi:ABC-type glycerol-3-phosphate transport system substrate-binding protein
VNRHPGPSFWSRLASLSVALMFGVEACAPAAPPASPTAQPGAASVSQASPVAAAARSAQDTIQIALPGYAFSLNPEIVRLAQVYSDEHPDQPPIKLTLSAQAQDLIDTSKFVLEAKEQRSSFDAWFGITPFIDTVKLVEGGVLEPWDAYLPADIKSDIFPSNLQEGTYQGKLYSWPQIASVTGLNYRPSMLKAAGYDKPPATWDEMLKVAGDVDAKLKPVRGLSMDTRVWRSLIPLAVSLGGDKAFGSDGYLNWDDPSVSGALDLMAKLGKYAPPDIFTATGDVDVFKTSQTSMMIKYVDAGITAAKAFGMNDYAFAALPAAQAGGKSRTVQWGTGFALFKYAKHKKEVADFISYLVKNDDYQNGWLNSGEPIVLQSWYTKLGDKAPAWLAANSAMLQDASFIPPTKDFLQMATVTKPWVEKVLKGEATSQQALQGAKADFDAALKRGT